MAVSGLSPTGPSVIFLERVSTDKQDCARQRSDRERLKARSHLNNVLRTVELVGVSGIATLNNEQVQEILAALKDPTVDGIGVSSLDRLFRPGKKWAQWSILDEFQDNGKRIWSQREGEIDPATDEGYDKCLQAGGRAGAEWRQLKQRTIDGIMEVLVASEESGVPLVPHGVAKFGYDLLPKNLAVGAERLSLIIKRRSGWSACSTGAIPAWRRMKFRLG